ncbi:uncharacterized protein LOC120358642 [Solenopsis invicta]|uniref:uncharacterized protein LOC120358642 n=1 Tax=Solenopsis invicta TaxID=13686 RepID=UPI00193D6C5B|nr:uncharacterized protein LOC120358642 [Solenopsis invicta]
MKQATMNMLMFFIFASEVLHIFAKVTVLRGPLMSGSDNVKMICLSEDDGGALVWNNDLDIKNYTSHTRILNGSTFDVSHDINNFENDELACKMNNTNENCLKSWIIDGWNITDSLKTPMGPVFDRRWEQFKQYEIYAMNTAYIDVFNLTTEVKLSFSVQSEKVNIYICNRENMYSAQDDFCYLIEIKTPSVYVNKVSIFLYKCQESMEETLYCNRFLSSRYFENEALHKEHNQWQTFVITWNDKMQEIKVYNNTNEILAYTDEVRLLYPNNNYYMDIQSTEKTYLRFHIYDFLHTTIESAILTSPIFQVHNEVICVQLLVGLCVECDAQIVLRDSTKDVVLANATVTGSTKKADHGLPMWQSVTIKKKLSNTEYNAYNGIMIQLIPKLSNHSSNPLWAIANVRQCPPIGALRQGITIINKPWLKSPGHYSSETCQKLFYDEHVIVNPFLEVTPDINLDENCSQGKIGPKCSISCESDLNSNVECKGIEICYENGCTCPPGFVGKNCSTRVNKPNAPTIVSINETAIWAVISIPWKEEYEGISIFYSFVIQGHYKYGQQQWKKLFRNMTQLTEYFVNMEPGVTYQVGFSLDFDGVLLHSDWQLAETECNFIEEFDVTPESNSLIIDWRINPNQLNSCPASWYHLVIFNGNSNDVIVSKSVPSFPYYNNLLSLPSYTLFNVTISHKSHKLFSQEVCTLEGVPFRVVELRSTLPTSTHVTLTWRPPYQPNGKIVKYEVILKVVEYYGCKHLKLFTPDNHIITNSTSEQTITFSNLRPYASYRAQVIAHNTRHFSTAAEIIFNTTQSEVPLEVFSQLKVQDWKLSWQPPEDCTTISGPMKARIKIRGISDAVKSFNSVQTTSFNVLNLDKLEQKLNGAEQYMATVYVIRDYSKKENASAYQKFEFETPPTAPPKVTNLEVVEIDTRQTPALIYLRWQSPVPPLNGKLRIYGIQLCGKCEGFCSIIEVLLNETCDLWDDYICKAVQKPPMHSSTIKVLAYNMNVCEPGLPDVVTDVMLRNTTPDAPDNYTFTMNNNSVIDLKWLHPWKTGGHLESFRIRIEEISSNLRTRFSQSLKNETIEYPVTQYMRNYSKRLYLYPSTQYTIQIQAVTVANESSSTKFIKINTPSAIVFDNTLEVMEDDSNSTILINIPSVSNDTQDSMMHIFVKGSNTCKQYSEIPENLRTLVNVKTKEIAWQAAEISTNELAGKRFRVGDNKFYGNSTNCPLKYGEFYEILIILVEQNSTTLPIILAKLVYVGDISNLSIHYTAWPISIILLLVTGAVFYLYQRKRQKSNMFQIRNEIPLSQNNYEHETKLIIPNSNEAMAELQNFDP